MFGVDQIDAVLCEDMRTIFYYLYSSDDDGDDGFVGIIAETLPQQIAEDHFPHHEFSAAMMATLTTGRPLRGGVLQ